jgi:hypothetical protein
MTEEGALRLPPGKYHVSGYFQDPKYFEEAQKLGYFLELESRSPSTWFQEQMVNLRGKRAVGIHVRRGDTLRLPDHGVLSADYYRRALLSLGDEDRSDLYLVFSDERLKLQEEFKDLSKIADLVFLSPPQDSNPIESIILMSHCSTLIISNSTYSWWGASLGDGSKKVISPKYWSPNQKTALPSPSSQSWEWLMPSWRKIDAP